MATEFLPAKFTSVAGTGSAVNLLAATAGNAYKVWQLVIANSAASAAAVVLSFTLGAAQTLTIEVPASGSTVLPMSGVPWILADTDTAITFDNASTITVSGYYTQG